MISSSASRVPDFENSLMTENWVEHEFQHLKLADERLNKRLKIIVEDVARKPNDLIPKACESWARAKACYRFFDNEASDIISSHYQSTTERIAQQQTVLIVNDTTTLNYTSHPETPGLGTIGSDQDLGIMLHDTMAFTTDGVSLGLVDLQTWTRSPDEYGKRIHPLMWNQSVGSC
jgi:hypothetical protein